MIVPVVHVGFLGGAPPTLLDVHRQYTRGARPLYPLCTTRMQAVHIRTAERKKFLYLRHIKKLLSIFAMNKQKETKFIHSKDNSL